MGSIMEIKDWWPKQSCDTVSLNDLPCWHISVADGQYMYIVQYILYIASPRLLKNSGNVAARKLSAETAEIAPSPPPRQ